MLGTGTPNADPDRWGPAVAIVVGDQVYLVDAGVGVVRRAAAARAAGVAALTSTSLSRVFLTHLHSDHTLGLPDLMFSPWVLERKVPLDVFGPKGSADMAAHIEAAWRDDIAMRLYGLEPQRTRNYRAIVHEIKPGRIYEDAAVKVDAIPVTHGSWPEAFAYRFTTADRVVVISGDTTSNDAVAAACNGCDVLMHEVYSAEKFKIREPEWQRYHKAFHTSTVELAALAAKARPKLLVLYHQLFWGATDDDLVKEIRAAGYMGAVVSGQDLHVY
ncbi:MAG: MBL fold metallo-hydrolase [Acidobacteria bacterium]|nr:MAG: MBL fold metallo-hydrolase [Acidobacteriota bacterium]